MQDTIPVQRNFCIILNSNAGSGRPLKVIESVEKELLRRAYTYTIFQKDLPILLDDFSDLIIIGGDGTINKTLNHFKEIPIPIIILPAGTGNDFSWKFSGKRPIIDVLKQAINAKPIAVDAGICNGHIFLNGVGIGLDGQVAKQLGAQKSLGFFSYLIQVLKTIFTYREAEIKVCWNGIVRENEYLMISAANGSRFGGGFMVAPMAEISDGQLELVLIKPLSIIQRLRYLPLMKKGKHLSLHFVEYSKTRKLTIESKVPLAAHLDGEVIEANRFEIEVMEKRYWLRGDVECRM